MWRWCGGVEEVCGRCEGVEEVCGRCVGGVKM